MFSFLNYTDKKYNDTFYIFIKNIGCKMRSKCDVELFTSFREYNIRTSACQNKHVSQQNVSVTCFVHALHLMIMYVIQSCCRMRPFFAHRGHFDACRLVSTRLFSLNSSKCEYMMMIQYPGSGTVYALLCVVIVIIIHVRYSS